MRRFKTALIICFLSLYGCTPVHTNYIDENHIPKLTPDKAIIFGSVTQSKNVLGGTNARFFIDSKDDKKGHYMLRPKKVNDLLIGYRGYVSDFKKTNGRLFALEVPAGKHQVDSWNVDTGNATLYPKIGPNPLIFEIQTGEVIYIGNLHMEYKTSEGVLGLKVTTHATPEIKDKRERDLKVFLDRYKNYKKEQITYQVLPIGPWEVNSPNHIKTKILH